MQLLKIVFVAAFALCALQAQGAEIPELRNATHLDLRLFIINGQAIAKNLFTAVNSGLDKSKPNVDLILNELAPEAKALARKTIDKVRTVIYDEEKRVDHIFKTLEKALTTLKPVKPCYDKSSPDAKKVALKTEKEIVKLINTVHKKYEKEIGHIETALNRTVNNLRKLFDTEVDGFVKCFQPGRKDAKECVNQETDKTVHGIFDAFIDIYLIMSAAQELLAPMLNEILSGAEDIFKTFVKDVKPVLNNFADCISKMK